MGFTETLSTIAGRIEGCAAVVILGIDGIAIERHVHDLDPRFDIDVVATEFTSLVSRGMRTASDTELGDLNEIVLAADKLTLLLRPITPEYFLFLALNTGGNIGRARFELRKAQLEMEVEFAI
jgi:predicted regulator of Ras-like GTPase activity (Roadblock/LC7/MglB family)